VLEGIDEGIERGPVHQPFSNRVYLDLPLDWRLLVFTMAIAVATTLLFGVAPALRATRVVPMEALKDSWQPVSCWGLESASGSLSSPRRCCTGSSLAIA